MGAFQGAIRVIFKRPFIIIFFGVIALALTLIEHFVTQLFIGVSTLGSGNIFESAVSFIQLAFSFLTNKSIVVKGILIFIGSLFGFSLIAGFLFSGYMNIINNALNKKPKFKGEFIFGVKKYFSKTFIISFFIMLLGVLFILFMAITTIPSLVITRSAGNGRPEFFLVAGFVDFLTLGVLFFGFMFFRIYMFFWYPAALNRGKSAFITGKRVADKCFWHIVSRFLVFDLFLIAFQFLFIYSNYLMIRGEGTDALFSAALFLGNWLFKTFFCSIFIAYIFSAFKIYSEKIHNKI